MPNFVNSNSWVSTPAQEFYSSGPCHLYWSALTVYLLLGLLPPISLPHCHWSDLFNIHTHTHRAHMSMPCPYSKEYLIVPLPYKIKSRSSKADIWLFCIWPQLPSLSRSHSTPLRHTETSAIPHDVMASPASAVSTHCYWPGLGMPPHSLVCVFQAQFRFYFPQDSSPDSFKLT